MAKRNDTLEIEKALVQMTKDKGIYGCEEITIGFVNQGHGNEIVDFMTMNSKGIFRCYEIKVTISDLRSSAKKSWYGHYNYLVVSHELYEKIEDWTNFLPYGVGLIKFSSELETIIKPKKQNISNDIELMLAQSMSRSMYYKMNKYYDSQSIEKIKKIKDKLNYWERQYSSESKERIDLYHKIKRFERLKRKNEGKRITLEECIEIEKQKAGITDI